MKIAIVCYPTFGGSGVIATELGVALAKKKHQVHFITYKQPVRLDLVNPNIFFHKVLVPTYPLFQYQPYELALSSKLVDMVRLHGIELVHVHYAIPHAYAAYMAKKMLQDQNLKIPIVTTLHGTDITLVGKHPFYKTAASFSINHSDMVTAVSESLRRETLNFFDVKKDIQVIPNFIEISKYPTKLDCERHILASPDEKIITHISNFRKVKRVEDVVHVFYNVQKKIKSKLIMVGEGPDQQKCEQLCKKLKIEKQVLFFGNTNDVNQILCFSDIFLLPSQTESFGLAALEAMANGVPVVSTDTGGLPELNIDNETGFLCAVGDINQMTLKIIDLLKDEKKLNLFKKNAYQRARHFSISDVVNKYEDVYKKAINDC